MKNVLLGALLFILCNPVGAAEDWPGFRGPTRQGISQEKDLPIHWSATENVAWKIDLPGLGYSSPITSNGRVYVTTATEEGASLRLLCADAASGKVLWNKEIIRQRSGHKQENNSYATPTPVTDGKRLYVLTEDGTLLGLTMEGEEVWRHKEFDFFSEHGIAVSPILEEGVLVVAYDGSSGGEDGDVGWRKPWDEALVLAVDAATGVVRWRGKRGMSRIAHVVPQTVTVEGKTQVVSAAGDVLQGFDFETGALVWTVRTFGEGLVPSVIAGDGMVYSTTGWGDEKILAVRTGGQGDCTETHVAWSTSEDVPKVPSMLYVKPYLYALADNGILNCFNAETGEVIWRERIRGQYLSSPLWAAGYIYVTSRDGKTTVLKAGPTFEVVAENELEGTFRAGIAVSDGRLFLRSDDAIYAIGSAE